MKTLGAIFIVVGILMTILGYEQYGNFDCQSHVRIVSTPFNSGCEETLLQIVGRIMTYSGFVVTGIGMILFVLAWRKENSLAGVEK
ncbi:MAG: hypothetical protein KGH87_00870 [Thaumarchaeota archaeon]|nr:hypothetical protein [Nitrososphaerota archaeon]MDE1813836.1 hypothetical protein [Nitrososphaerota archaeon]MDE1838447.1 hypothetical protein [Nitrososphaerota archaeon]